MENFLTAVKGWIERLGLSLAEAAQRAGMDPAELGRILEATQRAPSLGVVLHLLERLGLGIVGVEPATVAGLLAHLESCRATRQVSLRMLAERAGVDRNNLKRLLTSQDQDPRLDTILRLASALECDLVIAALRQPATVVPPEVSVRSAALVEVAEGDAVAAVVPVVAAVPAEVTAEAERVEAARAAAAAVARAEIATAGAEAAAARMETAAAHAELATAREAARSELEAVRAELAIARAAAAAAREETEAAGAELATARMGAAAAQERTEAAGAEAVAARAEVKAARAEVKVARAEVAEARRDAEVERANTAEVWAKVEATAKAAKADAEAARKELAQALRSGEHATKESNGLREQLEAARKELAQALRAGDHAMKESKGLREQLEAARKELAEALRAGDHAMKESKGLRGQLEGAWEEVEAVRAAADAEVRRRRDAEETIAGLRVRVGALEGERNTWGAQRDRMTRELEASQRELEQLRPSADQVAALKAKLVDLRREIAQSRDAHDQIRLQEQRALAALTKERDELQIALFRAQEVVQYKSVEVIVVRRHMSRVDPERLKREIEENLERVRAGP